MLVAGGIALAAFTWLILFQIALALGAPLGHLAWGGRERVLSRPRRVASALSVALVAFGAVVTLHSLGVLNQMSGQIVGYLHWAFAALFTVSVVGNLATESVPERLHGVPLTLCLVVSNAYLGWVAE